MRLLRPAAFFPAAACVLACALGALAPGCAPRPAGPGPGPGSLIVSNRSGAWRIYELEPADGTARLIGSGRADDPSYEDSMPARLPDGRIAFVSDRDGNPEIYLATADGQAVARLTSDPPGPASAAIDSEPAPLGRDRIVFARSEPGAPAGSPRDLHVLRLDRPEVTRITRHPGDDHAPWGTADGRGIVFVSDRGGAPRIWRMADVDRPDPESAAVDLTGEAPSRGIPILGAAVFRDGAPMPLADGSVVFSRAPEGAPPQLFVVGPSGARAGLRQITDTPTLPYGADEPQVLPDLSIQFVSGPFVPPPVKEDAPKFAVYRIASGGFNLTRVSRDRAGYDDFTRRLTPRP